MEKSNVQGSGKGQQGTEGLLIEENPVRATK